MYQRKFKFPARLPQEENFLLSKQEDKDKGKDIMLLYSKKTSNLELYKSTDPNLSKSKEVVVSNPCSHVFFFFIAYTL